jgi:hypothetical protein
MIVVVSVTAWGWIVGIAGWVGAAGETTEGRQDKRPHIAAWRVGCFDWPFSGFLHLAGHSRDVRSCNSSNDFNKICTSQRVTP